MDLGSNPRKLLTSLLPGCLLALSAGCLVLLFPISANPLFGYTAIGLMLLSAVLIGLLALRTANAQKRQIGQLKQAIRSIQSGQTGSVNLALADNQLNQLATALNALAQTLTAQQLATEQQIRQSREDARAHLQTSQVQRIELDMARQDAQAASQTKHDFLANMSHEIRTPLNGILGFTQLLQKSALTQLQLDHLQTIHSCAENLLGMLNQALDFSRIEAGTLLLQSQPFNLGELIQECLSVVAPAAHDKQLELVSMVYRDTPQNLLGDPLRLRQVLINLLSNAVKFTSQGSIVVRAMLEDETSEFAELRISVQDTGISMESTESERVFQAFSQVDNSLSRRVGGSGMGLAIARHLIELMGGKVAVENVAGAGVEFSIRLSLAKSASAPLSAPAALQGQRVAIFEAHPQARLSLQHQLADCGLQVLCFEQLDNLCQAVAAQQHTTQAIHLAVLGINSNAMPAEQLGMYLSTLRHLGCRVLAVCPMTQQQRLAAALTDDNCLLQCKPVNGNKLASTLEALLERSPAMPKQLNQLNQRPIRRHGEPAPRVLCVDDNPANLRLVQALLSGLGAQVTAVESGYAALQADAAQNFDLILMDIRMPGMDGRQASMAIRQREKQLQRLAVPIIALTAHVLLDQKRSLLQAGMQDLLNKPVSEAQLAQLLNKWAGACLQQPETANEPPAASGIGILDHHEALRLAGGKADLANDLLSMLLDTLEAEQKAIRAARSNGNPEQLAEQIHRLLGATRYCGVPQLRAACQHCENLLRQDAAQAGPALDLLDQAISRLLQESRSPLDTLD